MTPRQSGQKPVQIFFIARLEPVIARRKTDLAGHGALRLRAGVPRSGLFCFPVCQTTLRA